MRALHVGFLALNQLDKKWRTSRLIGLSVVMLVTGYFGEAVFTDQAALWGAISSAAYFVIV